MLAVVCKELGPPSGLSLEQVPDPEPGPGEVRVRIEAAGVNFTDLLLVGGGYQMKPPLPFVAGSELAGTVDALGDGVDGVAIGDRVAAMTSVGAFAEAIVLPAETVLPVPDVLETPTAATFFAAYGTALFGLSERGHLQTGEVVLVLGAGGGIGLAAVDTAAALGATVVAAASSPDKLEAAAKAGATHLVDYLTDDLKARVRELVGQTDVVFDPVGGELSEAAMRTLGSGGRHVVIGFASGTIPALPANHILLNNRSVVGAEIGGWFRLNPDRQRAVFEQVVRLVAEGRTHPAPPQLRGLSEAPVVLEELAARKITGRVALVPEKS